MCHNPECPDTFFFLEKVRKGTRDKSGACEFNQSRVQKKHLTFAETSKENEHFSDV